MFRPLTDPRPIEVVVALIQLCHREVDVSGPIRRPLLITHPLDDKSATYTTGAVLDVPRISICLNYSELRKIA